MGSSTIVGLPYIGKSSLLYALSYHEPLPAEQRFILAYLDVVAGRFHTKPQSALLNAAWQQWVMQVGQPATRAIPRIGGLPDFARWVKALRGKGFRPILCLDGFASLLQEDGPLDDKLLALWRDLGNEGQLAFVLTLPQPLSTLLSAGHFQADFEAIFYQVELSLLPERSARTLLVEPARRQGVLVPPDLVERWLLYCGPYPLFLQMAGRLLFEALAANGRLDPAEEVMLQHTFQQQAKPYWQQIWQSLSNEARQSFPHQPAVPATPAERVVYRFLASRGLLLVEGQQYRPFSPAFSDWLKQTYMPRRPLPPPPGRPTSEAEAEKPNTGWLRRLWSRAEPDE
jgi:hypothetical protein